MAGGGTAAAAREVGAVLHRPAAWPASPITPARAMLLPCITAPAPPTTPQPSTAQQSIMPRLPQSELLQQAHRPQQQQQQQQQLLPPSEQQPREQRREVWVWVHPAARVEAVAALRAATTAASAAVEVAPLSAHLRRLELRGPTSAAALGSLLPQQLRGAPMTAAAAAGSALGTLLRDPRLPLHSDSPSNVPDSLQNSGAARAARASSNARQALSAGAVVEAGAEATGAATPSTVSPAAGRTLPGGGTSQQRSSTDRAQRRQWGREGGQAAAWQLWRNPSALAGPCSETQVGARAVHKWAHHLAKYTPWAAAGRFACDLWVTRGGRAQISEWRQMHRLSTVGLARPPPPPPPPGASATMSAQPAGAAAAAGAGRGCARLRQAAGCPAVLVKRRAFGSGGGAWSLVVPAGWVAPLWHHFVRSGVLPLGIREWQWVASDQAR